MTWLAGYEDHETFLTLSLFIFIFYQTSSGYTGFGSLTEAPQDPPLTAEKAGTVNLYRSQKLVRIVSLNGTWL